MGEVIWNDNALGRLQDIFSHIARNNLGAAQRIADAIFHRANALEDFPEMGARYLSANRNVRFLLYRRYRIVYEVQANRDVVVVGVFHTSRVITNADIADILGDAD